MTRIQDILGLVVKRMFENKGRVFLTTSGIVIGIFTFVFFIFAAQGLSNAISEQFSGVGLNSLQIQQAGGSQAQGGGPSVGEGGLTDTDVARVEQVVRDVDYVTPTIFYNGRFEYRNEQEGILLNAYPDEFISNIERDLGIEMADGRFLRGGDRGSIVLGSRAALETFSDELEVGQALRLDGRNFRIVGIIESRGDFFIDSSAFMSFDDIQRVSGLETYSNIRVAFLEGADLEENKARIERQFNPPRGEPQVTVTSAQEAIDQFNDIVGVLSLLIGFISGIALLVGGINVMNTMYANVLERINEISVLKAMGGRNSDILLLFLIESSLLGLIGALVGFLGAYGLAELLSFLISVFAGFNIPIFWDTMLFIFVMIGTVIVSIIFGTYPALRAAQVNPADNLRDE